MKAILKKRKRSQAGFSLAETLIAILILLMVSAIVAGAIPTASNVYTKTVDTANAQVLMSTVVTVLRDELSTATIISATGTTIEYINGNDGYRKLVLQGKGTNADDPAAGIWLCVGELKENPSTHKESIEYPAPGKAGARLLVSGEATTKNLSVKFDSVSYSNEMVVFSKLKVERSGSSTPLASRDSLRIRTIRQTAP